MVHSIIKGILLTYCLIIFPADGYSDDQKINQYYQSLNNIPKTDIPSRLERISAQFLGTAYLLGPLGEGTQGYYDQSPLFRFDAFDCQTFVETVLALAISNDAATFKKLINEIRYRKGVVAFENRN